MFTNVELFQWLVRNTAVWCAVAVAAGRQAASECGFALQMPALRTLGLAVGKYGPCVNFGVLQVSKERFGQYFEQNGYHLIQESRHTQETTISSDFVFQGANKQHYA
jgi:hypothetical protein